jgi:DNA-binding beta-propeller fold protein YncE
MRTDISKLSFDEINHFVGVFQQMGRMPLDAEFNEQNELMLRLAQRLAGDAVHTGSPNEGFRVDTRVLLDKLESRRGLTATPGSATVFVDYFDHRVGDGSVVVAGATAIVKTLGGPVDLSGIREALVAVKGGFAANEIVFTLTDAATATHDFTMTELAPENGWRIFSGVPGALPPGFQLDAIVAYAFTGLDSTERYSFDFLKIDVPIRVTVARPELASAWTPTPSSATLELDDDNRVWGSLALKATGASALAYAFPAPLDLRRKRALAFALKRSPAAAPYTVEVVDTASAPQSSTLAGAVVASVAGWEIVTFTVPQGGTADWGSIAQLKFSGLSAAATYSFGPVLLEVDPGADLIVMGGDGSAEGAGRFYGDGVAAVKERHESYTTQRDLPEPALAALDSVADGDTRIDWAYLDLWERPLTYIEKPMLREPALEGADTATRTQVVAQVRLLAGQEVALPNEPAPPAAAFAALPRWGKGTLTTKDTPAAALEPCADPCEPAIAGPYLGEENRLFRVEIHGAGDIGLADAAGTALFKWSRDNGAVASGLTAEAASGATSAEVEKPELFAIGDLIEISDDLVELVTGPVEDTATHREHARGEMRRISTVNMQTRRVSWDDPTSPEPTLHAPLSRAMRLVYHAKVTKWDALLPVTAGDVALADGVTIEFGGHDFIPGDYWLFTTRTVDRSVERLIEAPPRGVRHAYFLLAGITRAKTDALTPESVVVEDLRARFAPLPELDASRISFDPSACAVETPLPDWDKVATVQQAIDAVCRADLNADLRLHNKLLHGYGIVCGLKVRCAKDREHAILSKGYALDCEGHTLHVGGDTSIDLVAQAAAQGLLDGGGDGKALLRIERSVAGDPTIVVEPHVPQSFLDSVLEGTLIKDFWDKCILTIVNFFKAQLSPFPETAPPLSDKHKRVIALLNLLWQKINAASGPYVWVSKREHDLLEKFHQDLEDLLASSTFCGMFDGLQPYPAYPYGATPGIDTMFGLLAFHQRMRAHPGGRYVYAFHEDNQIQVFDLVARELVQVLAFPGGTNVRIQDVAFDATGAQMNVVGVMSNNTDSVFANAAIDLTDQSHTWGPTSVVCDILFVKLGRHPAHPTSLYAVGRSSTNGALRGLYVFDPNAVTLAPLPGLAFNATGLFEISPDGAAAYAAEHSLGAQTGKFDRVRSIDLGNLAGAPIFFPVGGTDASDDLKVMNGRLYVTGDPTGGQIKSLHRFNVTSNVPLGPVDLLVNDWIRLAAAPSRNTVLVSHSDRYELQLYDAANNVLALNFRVPVQVIPLALAIKADDSEVYALNFFGNTVNVIDVAALSVGPPSFTFDPPVTLADYRALALQSFTDLFGVFAQSLKDCFCDKFLIECPECGPDDKIYLGLVDIKGGKIWHICNFTKRHYAKSFRTWSYWLSTIPILPLVKKSFAAFCCKVF